MKKFTVLATLSFTLLGTVCALADDQTDFGYAADPRPSTLAPADTYFGRFRMSILGIRNAIKDVALRTDGASFDDLLPLYHKLIMTEDALGELRRQYPLDSWVPKLGLSIAQAFAKFPFEAAHVRANDDLDWIIADYPDSDQAYFASDLRDAHRRPPVSTNVPIEPTLPSYAIPRP